ncbi:response regulator [Hungatella hathewayi]|nr:response regulator [Hungatella hathewayi]
MQSPFRNQCDRGYSRKGICCAACGRGPGSICRKEDVNLQILIVDDDDAIRAVIRKFIKEDSQCSFAAVFESRDGIEAFEKVCMYPIDIIFTDVKMPRCSGIGLMERLNGLSMMGRS